MKPKERAIAKGEFDAMQQIYLDAWRKNPTNPKLKEMWEKYIKLSTHFDRACAEAEYYREAAVEREDKWYLIWVENQDLKKQIEILKEANDKAVKDWCKEMREFEKEWED